MRASAGDRIDVQAKHIGEDGRHGEIGCARPGREPALCGEMVSWPRGALFFLEPTL